MPAPQNLKNHAQFDPITHFILVPLLLLNLILVITATVHHWPEHRVLHLWLIVMAIVFLLIIVRGRANDLKLQDRIIRLEERLRLATLLPPADHAHLSELTTKQLVALRFASDAEIPALVHKTLTQGLEPKAIKENIQQWRPDYERV